MPGLPDLPTEFLLNVASQIRHGDIVNLGVCSQRVHTICANVLQRHKTNRDAYLPLRFGDIQQSPYPLRNPLPIIRDIIRNADYPIKIIIDEFMALGDLSHITSNANIGWLGQIVAYYRPRIRALVRSSDYVDYRAMWTSILAKEHGPAIAFLLTILPDLRSIHFGNLSMSGAVMLFTVQKILNESRNQPRGSHPLIKLVMVSSRGLIDDYENWVKLGLFVQLHSLRSVSCQYVLGNVNAVREKAEPWINDPERLSDMTSLEFSKCALEKPDLVPIFESIKPLRAFNYEFSGSLVTLEMTTVNIEELPGFEKIKADTLLFIETSLEIYVVKAIKQEFKTARQKKNRKGNHHFALSHKEHMELVDRHTHYAINTDDRVHRLETLLPESLEKLTLCVTLFSDSFTIEPMFNRLLGGLTKLKTIVFKSGNPLTLAKEAAKASLSDMPGS
ncbi:MAG: hypothetical protein Q9161_000489 [Pseudevernia consocians]